MHFLLLQKKFTLTRHLSNPGLKSLHKHKRRLYHTELHQELTIIIRAVRFCEWAQQQILGDRFFFVLFFLKLRLCFTKMEQWIGIIIVIVQEVILTVRTNTHNQTRWSINVWEVSLGSGVIGHVINTANFFDGRMINNHLHFHFKMFQLIVCKECGFSHCS